MSASGLAPNEKRRRRIAMGAALLAVAGTLLPLSLAGYYAWRTERAHQTHRLETAVAKVEERARLAFAQARVALDALQEADDPPCSPEHLVVMRRFTLNTLSLEEIGYVDGQKIVCTTWDERDLPAPPPPSDFSLVNGIEAFVTSHSHVRGSDPMLALRKGRYLALTNMGRFTDIIVRPGIQVAFKRTDGPVLSLSTGLTAERVVGLLADPHRADRDDTLLVSHSDEGWTTVAVSPAPSMREWLAGQWLIFPVGLVSAGLVAWLILRVSRRRLSPEAELEVAVREREFLLHYQPIVDLRTGRCVGAEALVRWQRPDGMLVRPDLFIPLAEEHGLISDITLQVIDLLVSDLRELMQRQPHLHVSMTLSVDDIATSRTLDRLETRLQEAGIAPAQVWLEITERGCVEGEASTQRLAAARAAGHRVAVDDFGTGYCSLRYLQTLPIDLLKIDGSFVQTIHVDAVTGTVLPHIIDLARGLGLEMVAEGVETQEQADYLAGRGVQYAQGWLYARAMPASEFIAFLEAEPA